MRTHAVVGLVAVSVLLIGGVQAEAASKCTALKYKLTARAAVAKAKCKAVAAKEGTEVDPACLAAADAKLSDKWVKAEGKGDCVETGDLSAAQAAVESFLSQLMDALEPPPPSAVCCNALGSCWHGFPDESGCIEFGGTLGAPGTVCDGATGTCQPPPAGSGQCCSLADIGVCNGGPSIDLAGCTDAGGLDYPFSATCLPSGDCAFPSSP